MHNLKRRLSTFSKLPVQLILVIIFLAAVPGRNIAQDGCSCTNCPQAMPDNFQGNFYIQVQNAGNPVLGQNGQGICGVTLNFDHDYVGDLTITLTSPSGQTVTLLGPVGLFGETDGTAWNITFLPCNENASPDPGFADIWSNNQNWGLFGFYTGSYYPHIGCLENFTGPVNGQWTLSVMDNQDNDAGNFYDYSIIFCDPTGIECTSCEASAGNLLQADISGCAGDASLDLNLQPTYVAPQVPPPANEYSYTYVIAEGGIIVAYADGPDLRSFPSGSYTVCGLSYLTDNAGEIPAPDGVLSISQLAAQLNSATPPFCGKITPNCVNVNILPELPDVQNTASVCMPDCYEYYGELFCTSGSHSVLVSQNGCTFTATLQLTVLPNSTKTIIETICPGTCAETPGFQNFCTSGSYTLALEGANGCDSLVTLTLNVLQVDAIIAPPQSLSCSQQELILQSTGSSNGTGVSYQWSAANGGMLVGATNQPTATASSAGSYTLIVCKTGGGVACCDTANVEVTGSHDPPPAPGVITGPGQRCLGQTGQWKIDSVPGASAYHWTVPPGVELLSGQNSPAVMLQWNIDSSGMICVQSENACGLSPFTCLNITHLDSLPAPDMLSGDSLVCLGDTVMFAVSDTLGASSFLWEFPPDAQVLSSLTNDTVLVIWQTAGSANVCVQQVNDCDTSGHKCLNVHGLQIPEPPALIGPETVCAGSEIIYKAMPDTTAANIFWEITGGTILGKSDSSAVVVQWDDQPGLGLVCAHVGNICGQGPEYCQEVLILPVSKPFAGPDTLVCGVNFTLHATPGNVNSTGYWSLVSGPGDVVFSDSLKNETVITVDQSGDYLFEWIESSIACMYSDSILVQFNSIPAVDSSVIVCDAVNEFYKIYLFLQGGTPPYTVNGLSVTGNNFVSGFIPNGDAYQFIISDQHGCSVSQTGIYTCACTTDAGQMSAEILEACTGQSVTAQHAGSVFLDGNDTSVFVLHTNPGNNLGQIIDQNHSGIFGFEPGMQTGVVYYISMVAGNNLNGTPDLTDPCLSVSQGQKVIFYETPEANAGADTVVCGTALNLNASAGNGYWSGGNPATSPGILTFTDSLSPQTSLKSISPGAYSVVWTALENGCAATDTVNVVFNENPVWSDLQFTCNVANENYTVQVKISGGAPPYSINNLSTTGDTFLSGSIQSGNSYTFQLSDFNQCTAPVITGSFACDCSTAAGAMSDSLLIVCVGDSVQVNTMGNYTQDGNDTLAYVLHDGAGILLGQIFAQNHTGVFGFYPGMYPDSVYYISMVVGNNLNGFPDSNDPCLAISAGQPVVFQKLPTPSAGLSTSICGLKTLLMTNPSSATGLWTQDKGPGTAIFEDAEAGLSEVIVSIPGDYVFRWTESNGICSAFDTVSIRFNEIPVIENIDEICIGTNTAYTVIFNITAGLPPFIIDGINGVLNGAAFLSAIIPNNSNYAFFITDANGCKSENLSGTHGCACVTDAGSMDTSLKLFCANEPATVEWNKDAALDQDDILQFILHDKAGDVPGNILAVNDQPVFAFGANVQTGLTYYISAIAGNKSGNTVDLNDACLSVAPGAPVQWNPLPSATIAGDTAVCSGQAATLHLSGTGTYPLIINYRDNTGQVFAVEVPDQDLVALPLNLATTTTFTFFSVSDGAAPSCVFQLNDSVTIAVPPPADAGIVDSHPAYCSGEAHLLALNEFITSENAGGIWSDISSSPVTGTAWNMLTGILQTKDLPTGNYAFQYFVSGHPLCPDDSVQINIAIHPVPQADAGPDALLDCQNPNTLLGGGGTSQGPGLMYQWTLVGASQPVSDNLNFSVSTPGQYALEVTNNYGCSAVDTAVVAFSGPPLAHVAVQVFPVRCYGEQNASIQIDSVHGGTAPVLFSLNGRPFSNRLNFNNLGPGEYVLIAQDAAGCEWSETIQIAAPVEIKIDLGADIEAALGDSLYLLLHTLVSAGAIDTIIWEPLLDSLAVGKRYQHFQALHSGKSTVTLIDTNGCVAFDDLFFYVNRTRKVYLANVFKPDSDQNENFTIGFGNDVQEVKVFEIFDRWGNKVHEAGNFLPQDSDAGWDGKFKGQQAPVGVYTYYLVIQFKDGETETFTGSLTLLR